MKVDFNKVMTALVTAFLLAVGGAIYDFQNVKANVSQQDVKIDIMHEDLREVKRDVKSLLRRK
jgi:hypothetical protein